MNFLSWRNLNGKCYTTIISLRITKKAKNAHGTMTRCKHYIATTSLINARRLIDASYHKNRILRLLQSEIQYISK